MPSAVCDGTSRIAASRWARARVHVGARLVPAQRLRVGIEDHLAAQAVDDDRHPRPDLVPQPLDADDVGQPQRARHDGGVRRAPAPLGAEAGRLGAPQLGGVRRRQLVRDGDAPLGRVLGRDRLAGARPGCAAGAHRPARRRSCGRGSMGPRSARTPPGSGPATCAPPTRPPSAPRGSCAAPARPGGRPTASAGAPPGCGTGGRPPRVAASWVWMRASCSSVSSSACSKRAISASTCSAAMRRSWMSTRLARTCATPMAMPGDAPTPTSRSIRAALSRIDPFAEPAGDEIRQRGHRRPQRRPPRRPSSSSPHAPPPASAGP